MRNLVKTACLSGIMLVSFGTAQTALAADASTRPHTPEASILPANTPPPATTSSAPGLDKSGLVEIMESNRRAESKQKVKARTKAKKRVLKKKKRR